MSGHGGGLAVGVFHGCFSCRSANVGHFPSFELELIKAENKDPFYYAVVYRPLGPVAFFWSSLTSYPPL